MVPLKPYVWLDEGNRKVEVKVNCTATLGVNYDLDKNVVSAIINNVCVITFTLTNSNQATGDIQNGSCIIPIGFLGQKVIVRLVFGNNLKGRTTVFQNQNPKHFEPFDYKIYCWLQFVRTGTIKNHFVIDFDTDTLNNALIEPISFSTRNPSTIILTYAPNTGGPINHYSFELNANKGYDPSTHDQIEVIVDDGGALKGKGTTTDNEADSSDDT